MEFYQSITQLYDHIFPLNMGQVNFVGSECLPAALLDVGCGTGSLAIAMSAKGFSVSAIDIDREMVDMASAKDENRRVAFSQGDMLSIDQRYIDQHFGVITCFGNTLVHLKTFDEVSDFFQKTYALLLKNGKLLLQLLNYEAILTSKPEKIPTIENERICFERKYYYQPDGKIDFEGILLDKVTGLITRNVVPLLPVTLQQLTLLLNDAGFVNLQFYGGFDRSPIDENKLPLIVSAQKM